MERSKLIKWYFVMNIYCYQENYKKPIKTITNILKSVNRDDIHIVGAKNTILNEHIKNNLDKIIVSLYPGIIFNQPWAIIGRLRADIVLLNSQKDYNELKKICDIFKVPFNGFLLGAAWYNKQKHIKEIYNKKYIVFFEQIDIPKSKPNRLRLLDKLCKFARQNPSRSLLIRSRAEYDKDELSLKNLSKDMSLPSNLSFTDIETSLLIENLDLALSISSSTCIEAILAGKKCIICDDFGYKDTFLGFYKNSGIVRKLENIDLTSYQVISRKWKRQNISNPYDIKNINKLIAKLYQVKKRKININKNIFIWIKLVFYYHKLFLKNPWITYIKIKRTLNIIGE